MRGRAVIKMSLRFNRLLNWIIIQTRGSQSTRGAAPCVVCLLRDVWADCRFHTTQRWISNLLTRLFLQISQSDRVVNGALMVMSLIRNVSAQLWALGNMLIKFLHVGKHESWEAVSLNKKEKSIFGCRFLGRLAVVGVWFVMLKRSLHAISSPSLSLLSLHITGVTTVQVTEVINHISIMITTKCFIMFFRTC